MATSANGKGQGPKARKRVDASELKRASDGSGFVRCDQCKKDVPVALTDMHSCGGLPAPVKVVRSSSPTADSKPQKKKKNGESKKRGREKKETKKSAKKNKGNLPKKPMTAFFLFMEDFRAKKKAENVKGSEVAKLGGAEWKKMTDEEKSPYVEKAALLKKEYDAAVKKQNDDNTPEANEDGGGESDEGNSKEMEKENADEFDNEDGDGPATEAEE